MLTIKESPGTPLFINKFVFLLSAGISLKVGTSRRLIMNRPSVHKKAYYSLGVEIDFKVNNTGLRSHCRFHGSAPLSYQTGFFQVFDRPFYSASGERQILCNGIQSRPRLFSLSIRS